MSKLNMIFAVALSLCILTSQYTSAALDSEESNLIKITIMKNTWELETTEITVDNTLPVNTLLKTCKNKWPKTIFAHFCIENYLVKEENKNSTCSANFIDANSDQPLNKAGVKNKSHIKAILKTSK